MKEHMNIDEINGEITAFVQRRSPILRRMVGIFSTAILTASCHVQTFLVADKPIAIEAQSVPSCRLESAPSIFGALYGRPYYSIPPSSLGINTPMDENIFDHQMDKGKAWAMLLDVVRETNAVHNAFVEKTGYGFKVMGYGEPVDIQWQKAMYVPMHAFVEKLKEEYPALQNCALVGLSDEAGLFFWQTTLMANFAMKHGFSLLLMDSQTCGQGKGGRMWALSIGRVSSTDVHVNDNGDVDVDKRALGEDAEKVERALSHASQSAVTLVQRANMPELLAVEKKWRLNMEYGTRGAGNVGAITLNKVMTVKGDDMTEEMLRAKFGHEIGHISHSVYSARVFKKSREEGVKDLVIFPIDGREITIASLDETIGTSFGFWAALTDGVNEGLDGMIYGFFRNAIVNYQLFPDLLLEVVAEETRTPFRDLKERQKSDTLKLAQEILRWFPTREKREELILRILGKVQLLVNQVFAMNWKENQVKMAQNTSKESQECE